MQLIPKEAIFDMRASCQTHLKALDIFKATTLLSVPKTYGHLDPNQQVVAQEDLNLVEGVRSFPR